MKRLLKVLTIHPFLFALFPIIALYYSNIGELSLFELGLPIFLVLISATLLFLTSILIFRSISKGAVMTTLFITLFFSYGHLAHYFNKYLILSVSLILIITATYLLIKAKQPLYSITKVLNIMSVCLIAVPVISTTVYEIQRSPHTTQFIAYDNITQQPYALPDIYYIVLDTYTSNSVLTKYYDFDNSNFLDHLTSEGFYVAPDSRSNYGGTWFSLATSLNMQYAHILANKPEYYTDMLPILEFTKNNAVGHFLQAQGYEYIHVGSRWEDQVNPYADINFTSSNTSDFRTTLWNSTMLSLLPTKYIEPIIELDASRLHYNTALKQFNSLLEISTMQRDQPLFVSAHLVLPHIPLIFDANGNYILSDPRPEEKESRYVSQLSYLNKRLSEIVDSILANSATPPVIILQGDHGPLWETYNFKPTEQQSDEIYLHILNAILLPPDAPLYASMTPINTFRVVFNYYFGTDYEMLEEKSYIGRDLDKAYKFWEVDA
jgi:hypothetical protein